MTPPPPGQPARSASLTRVFWAVALFALAMIVLTLLDRRLVHALAPADLDARARLESRDWFQFLRSVGYLPTWIVVGVAIALADRRARGVARGLMVVLAPILAGAIAELLKLVASRERPVRGGVIQNDGAYVWKGLFRGFVDSGNLGMPSSHAAVAFGGAAMLGMLFPAARWLLLALAAGCGLTRMLTGAHFASDVLVGAFLGVAAAWLLARLAGPAGASARSRTLA